MAYEPVHRERGNIDFAAELERARRVEASLRDPTDLQIVQSYIAEIEARMSLGGRGSIPAR